MLYQRLSAGERHPAIRFIEEQNIFFDLHNGARNGYFSPRCSWRIYRLPASGKSPDSFRIMAPPTFQRAALQKQSNPDSRPVVDRIALDVK